MSRQRVSGRRRLEPRIITLVARSQLQSSNKSGQVRTVARELLLVTARKKDGENCQEMCVPGRSVCHLVTNKRNARSQESRIYRQRIT